MGNSFRGMVCTAMLFVQPAIAQAVPTPSCRLDFKLARPVENAANRAIDVYRAVGISLPFRKAEVGKSSPNKLTIEIVSDATQDSVDSKGCVRSRTKAINENQPLDIFTVKGGCYVESDSDRLIRCSNSAIWAFAGRDINDTKTNTKTALHELANEEPTASPALLYVLAHEIAHIYQGRSGEFVGKVEIINLDQPLEEKRKVLVAACDSEAEEQEKNADELALKVLQQALQAYPYKQPALSSRGSLYWNIDKINLAADIWTNVMITQWSTPQLNQKPKVHQAFIPTEFPTPEEAIKKNASKFYCDVFTGGNGVVAFPLRATTHPPPEQRLRRIAEEIKPIADQLPADNGSKDYAPIAKLQNDLSGIFTHIYTETGIYMEALHREVCTLVNGELPVADCTHK